ncbi:MAG TPA: ATP-dependent 6-phosphofructokinase [Anaerohalosphaeraceae bacterium]|jgi:6-phosphofructokinase 1|nr:ATP-dependent 6-phosphofructokinase [Anaerohalosphaeraceae bacterium]HRT51200.1 ATP-dependent 6-phosphofructokinase [Anaerohalosphaeraceae bacterium]HRT87462.1 ATP-dependent 6-phosphofructokinase [Anaerohalosphaeraceae bacterium]
MSKPDFTIERLGEMRIPSPVKLSTVTGDYVANYVEDDERVLYEIDVKADQRSAAFDGSELMEKAGPRPKIYFDPARTHAGIVTCGGLCPGINDVIRAIVMCLAYDYGVTKITGFRFGYRGLLSELAQEPMTLAPHVVKDIHKFGGTILGSSRGYGERTAEMVDTLVARGVDILFAIGGDGTQRGAMDICRHIRQRGLNISVIGVPKTIDNDLSYVQQSFGFQTSVCKAVDAVRAAHTEAVDAINGVGLVKVMGRQSGYIAAETTMAASDVNFVLVPEVPFELEGDNGFLAHMERRLERRQHAVVLVAEGAGQDLLTKTNRTDASGNIVLSDIGLFLKMHLTEHFRKRGIEINLKYIDPSYIIRGAPANAFDSVYCQRLGTNAVHAAMAGKTAMVISMMHNHLVHVPMALTVGRRNCIDPDGALWRDVLDATGQPKLMVNG